MNLKDKVAIVSGGARDIGKAVSIKLASEGAKVVVNYFSSREQADETLRQIKAEAIEPKPVDVAVEERDLGVYDQLIEVAS